MRCGIYGKLPAKRDFVAMSAPREFLNVWEPWLQGGISASRLDLGGDWQAVFLRAPIWRFWLGGALCGATVAGAFMPSVDGVGRYFPLTMFACADSGAAIAPPEIDPQDAWFEAVERLLLAGLDATDFTAFAATIEAMVPPTARSEQTTVDGLTKIGEGTVVVPVAPGSLQRTLTAVRAQQSGGDYATATFWWTAGGEGLRPMAMIGTRMPNPHLFTGMLTGDFAGVFV